MALYIDVEPVVKQLTSVCVTDDSFGMGIQEGVNYAVRVLAKAPIVEAEPVVHAHWIYWWEDGVKRCKCPECLTSYGCLDTPRCPNCGAHMDEEVAE